MTAQRLPFEQVSSVTPSGPGHFEADVSPEWTIGGRPNGGYLLAMLGRAASAATPHPHVIAGSGHYVQPPDPGRVSIDVELLREGRSASQVRARMAQDNRLCVEALLTTSRLDPAAKPFWERGVPQPGHTAFDECTRLVPQSPGGFRVAIMEQIDVRLEPDSAGFLSGQPAGRGEIRGWLALPEDGGFDPTSLLFAVDAFPPATFDIELAGWVPTFELTAYVRALPAPGPVRVLHRAELIDARRVNEICHVWDQTGRLVAQGTQLAGIRLG